MRAANRFTWDDAVSLFLLMVLTFTSCSMFEHAKESANTAYDQLVSNVGPILTEHQDDIESFFSYALAGTGGVGIVGVVLLRLMLKKIVNDYMQQVATKGHVNDAVAKIEELAKTLGIDSGKMPKPVDKAGPAG